MFRKTAAKDSVKNNFRLRGHEIRRIETFSDAVFAFAVTLLIVSLEVPKNFDELIITMKGFVAFGISFLFLMTIWHQQNTFFRHYGLDDLVTIALNCTLIFVVLLFVYPLKFLFSLIFSNFIYGVHSPFTMSVNDAPMLMSVYGCGYISIYLIFLLMYVHAFNKKVELKLTLAEQFDTKTKMFSNFILIAIGILSITMSQLLPINLSGLAGYVYVLIGPAFTIFFSYRANKKRSLLKQITKKRNVEIVNDES